jgi:hypothetical protein
MKGDRRGKNNIGIIINTKGNERPNKNEFNIALRVNCNFSSRMKLKRNNTKVLPKKNILMNFRKRS